MQVLAKKTSTRSKIFSAEVSFNVRKRIVVPGGLGHSSIGMQVLFEALENTSPSLQKQLMLHTFGHLGVGSSHVEGHSEPQLENLIPTGQSKAKVLL